MEAYVAFVEEWCGASIDENLVSLWVTVYILLGGLNCEIQKYYLVSSMGSLISQEESSPSLLSGHLKLLKEFSDKTPGGPAKWLRTARKYSIQAPKSAHVWYERLEAERQLSEGRGVVDKVWAEARRSVEGSREELEKIWTWGLFWEEERLATYEVRILSKAESTNYNVCRDY
jgi:U3 small nucleolar RNA-associated protein 6